jgi:hypothetical protein
MDSLLTGYDEGCSKPAAMDREPAQSRSWMSYRSVKVNPMGQKAGLSDVRNTGTLAILHPDLWAEYEGDLNLSRSSTTKEEKGEQYVVGNPPTGNAVRFP